MVPQSYQGDDLRRLTNGTGRQLYLRFQLALLSFRTPLPQRSRQPLPISARSSGQGQEVPRHRGLSFLVEAPHRLDIRIGMGDPMVLPEVLGPESGHEPLTIRSGSAACSVMSQP